MKRKDDSVSLAGLDPKMRKVLPNVDAIWKAYGHEAIITAGTECFKGNEFIHSLSSFHPFGRALDFRTFYFIKSGKIDMFTVNKIAARLRDVLGKDYDVVVHSNHIHVEFDPK